MSDIRMEAYYYVFDKTNVDCVDELLSCVACAGKAFHHTSDWRDAATTYGEQTVGETPVDWIQNSAIRVATEITRLKEQNDKLREALVIAKGLLDAMKWSNEEPHEGSYGWIINQALSEEK